MRILMISDVYFPRVNGVSTSISIFRRDLKRLGHDVTLLAPAYPGDTGDDPDIIRIPSRGVLFDREDRMMHRAALMQRVPLLAQEGYDLVHIHTPFVAHYAGVRLARELGIPVVETYHTFFEEYLHHYLPLVPRRWMAALVRRIARSACNRVDALVVPSSPLRDVLERYGVERPVAVIPTGIDLEQFGGCDRGAFRQRLGLGPEVPLLGYVGRVAHEKNIGFLLEVMTRVRRELPQAQFFIAGEGPARKAMQRRAEQLKLGDSIHFVGYLERDGALQDCYCAADAFVFASRTETQGLVLLEAMALGVPVVSTAVLGTRDFLLSADGGAVVAEDNPGEFARRTVELLSSPARRENLAETARRQARAWSSTVMAERMADFYDRVCHPSGASEPVAQGRM